MVNALLKHNNIITQWNLYNCTRQIRCLLKYVGAQTYARLRNCPVPASMSDKSHTDSPLLLDSVVERRREIDTQRSHDQYSQTIPKLIYKVRPHMRVKQCKQSGSSRLMSVKHVWPRANPLRVASVDLSTGADWMKNSVIKEWKFLPVHILCCKVVGGHR